MCHPATGIDGDAVDAARDACGLGKMLEDTGAAKGSRYRQVREARRQ
jgi:hypothetical protein